ncbi:MAG TPA: SET domain-containing protein [Pirellulales bacterium]|nr:SET domain-containing protein [Pirellulales bacterium]
MRTVAADDEQRSRPPARDKHLHVRPTRTGRGIFTGRHLQPWQIVGEILGRLVDDPDYSSSYCFELGDDRCLEPDPPFRFLNHSCSPNCRFQWYDVKSAGETDARRRGFVLALRAIASGEQLTIDYRWPAAMAIPCRCGELDCRGWVVDRLELDSLPARAGRS